ncbi:MAG: glycerophosphodiester phosphodiesterase family protein [Xanthobacteraceae bacterium]
MAAPDWLTARPIAHRGLHNAASGIIENTASAATAAITGNYAIETDVQISADGEAMIFHDDELERLTEGHGPIAAKSAADLKRVAFRNTIDRMMTLGECCDLIARRTPLVVEIKSRFDGDLRLAERVAAVLKSYAGPAAVMSFDPQPVAAVRRIAPALLRGIVAEWRYNHPEWKILPAGQRRSLALMLHATYSRPQFIAYYVNDLPSPVTRIARNIFGIPLLTWTVRTDAQRATAAHYADQMIFEGFRA